MVLAFLKITVQPGRFSAGTLPSDRRAAPAGRCPPIIVLGHVPRGTSRRRRRNHCPGLLWEEAMPSSGMAPPLDRPPETWNVGGSGSASRGRPWTFLKIAVESGRDLPVRRYPPVVVLRRLPAGPRSSRQRMFHVEHPALAALVAYPGVSITVGALGLPLGLRTSTAHAPIQSAAAAPRSSVRTVSWRRLETIERMRGARPLPGGR